MGADVESCGDGGGISVQGDTTINNTGLKTLGAIVLTLLALAAGVGGTALFGHLLCTPKPTTVAVIETPAEPQTGNWRLGLKVTDAP